MSNSTKMEGLQTSEQLKENKATYEASLLQLNDDCFIKLFIYLGLDDSIDLVTTCRRLKDLS